LLGKKIAVLRKGKKMRQEDLANLLGVSRQAISNYEKGERYPDPQMLSRMARLFKVSSDYLLDLTDDPKPHWQVCEEPCVFMEKKPQQPAAGAREVNEKTLSQLCCLLKKLDKEDLDCLLHLVKRLTRLE